MTYMMTTVRLASSLYCIFRLRTLGSLSCCSFLPASMTGSILDHLVLRILGGSDAQMTSLCFLELLSNADK